MTSGAVMVKEGEALKGTDTELLQLNLSDEPVQHLWTAFAKEE